MGATLTIELLSFAGEEKSVKGQHFQILKDSYVIFICENDKFQKGLPIYHIDRCIC